MLLQLTLLFETLRSHLHPKLVPLETPWTGPEMIAVLAVIIASMVSLSVERL